MARIKLFIPVIVFFVLAILFYFSLGKDPSHLPSALIGKPLPNFELTNLKNNRVVTQKDIVGREPFLLNIWATWCAECRREHPVFLDLQRQGVNIVGLNYKDDRDEAIEWLRRLENPYSEVIFDEEGILGLDLGVYGAPETFVVDKDGTVLYKHVGAITEKLWRETLAPLMRN